MKPFSAQGRRIGPHLFHRPHHPPVAALELVDGVEPLVRLNPQPQQNRGEMLGNGPRFVRPDRPAGPVHQREVIPKIEAD